MGNPYNDLLISNLHQATSGETLDAEKNLALFKRVATGDATAREEMIVGNMPLAVTNVESFIRSCPGIAHLRDDLVSAAFTGLVEGVNRIATGKGPRSTDPSAPVEFLGMWINRELRNLIASASLIRLPPRSRYRARAQGQELNPPTVHNVVPERFEVPSYQKELETRDLIESCCTCDAERTFVAMREAGYKFTEIAAALHMPVSSTHVMVSALEARVRRKMEAVRNQ